jgi:hypothetical protein
MGLILFLILFILLVPILFFVWACCIVASATDKANGEYDG